jgi:hypothetical protein
MDFPFHHGLTNSPNTAPALSPIDYYNEDLIMSTTEKYRTSPNTAPAQLESHSEGPVPNYIFLTKYALPPGLASLSATANGSDMRLLPLDFEPSEFDVVCGRGKGSYNAPGCKKLRALIREYIPEYTSARSKFDKTTVLSRIVDVVQSQNNYTAKFVKKDVNGVWCEISNDQAREKVGHTMRETISALRSQANLISAPYSSKDTAGEWDVETKSAKQKAIMESFKNLRRCSKMSQLKVAQDETDKSA